ncbi:MAG: amidohydrolase family protein [Desulfatiglandales bacterium]|jgi:aminocarboxymuconate-semialdehyde decarboxylase|nr:amidohydrolase family protein [Desulfatiglandales bacterium]
MNNYFISDICKKIPDRFMAFGSIPLNNLTYAVDELHRVIHDLDMDGIVLGSNINQRSLSEDQFLPFFEETDRINVPLLLHPLRAIGEDLMPEEDRTLTVPPNVGFIFETTRTMAQMTFKGTFEEYGNLTFILSHSGSAVPFIYPRWDIGYLARPDSHPIKRLPNPPSHYLKKHYYETAQSFSPSALRCTIALAGLDHIFFGTDCPYANIDFRATKTIENIEASGFSNEEKEKIYFKDATKLFPKILGR